MSLNPRKHVPEICPRCGGEFLCCPNKGWDCGCGEIKLSQKHREYMASLYDSCLCNSCLQQLRDEYDGKVMHVRLPDVMNSRKQS